MTTALDCLFCIDGHMPAGTDDAIGELYEHCPACTPACSSCHGFAVFPALFASPLDLVAALLRHHLGVVFCPGCLGVLTVITLGPEVNP